MKPKLRKKARRSILQALYQIHMGGPSLLDTEAAFLADMNPAKVDLEYFQRVLNGVEKHKAQLDALFTPYLDREHEELTPIELCILRLACYEMKYEADVPYKVIINEALELTKAFGAQDAHKFVNGVLDKLARDIREAG